MTMTKISYWWSVLYGLIFLVIQMGTFYFRYNTLSIEFVSYILFFIIGLVAGLFVIYMVEKGKSVISLNVGAIIALPVALILSIIGGLFVLSGLLGVLVGGIIPFLIIIYIASFIGVKKI